MDPFHRSLQRYNTFVLRCWAVGVSLHRCCARFLPRSRLYFRCAAPREHLDVRKPLCCGRTYRSHRAFRCRTEQSGCKPLCQCFLSETGIAIKEKTMCQSFAVFHLCQLLAEDVLSIKFECRQEPFSFPIFYFSFFFLLYHIDFQNAILF